MRVSLHGCAADGLVVLARRFSQLRMALLPYLYQAYSDYHRKGVAPVRPYLVADWPEDSTTWKAAANHRTRIAPMRKPEIAPQVILTSPGPPGVACVAWSREFAINS